MPFTCPHCGAETETENSRMYGVRGEHTRATAAEAVRRLPVGAGLAYRVTIELEGNPHTEAQRKLVFALCTDIGKQQPFPGGGKASATNWYRFLIGLHRGEAMARDGNVVVIVGGGLSGATKMEASELIEFIYAWGAERGVRFSAPKRYEEEANA